MEENDILEAIQQAVREETGDPTATITTKTQASDVVGWDSLAHGRILLSIEVALAVRLDIEATYRAANIGDLVRIIGRAAEHKAADARDQV